MNEPKLFPLRMVDLEKQYIKIKNEVDAAIQEVIESTAFINGPAVKDFQSDLEDYLGVKHVIPCANGTDALQVSMMALDLKPGDEVITTAFTFVATVEVIALLGLKPVLVDVDPHTFNIDPAAIEKAVSPKTKAIVPVHLFGQCADMDEIMKIAEKYKLFVIEDNCQAIGAEYFSENGKTYKAGTIGTLGCTSFFPSKNLGCYGDGGAVFTNDDELATQLRSVVNHGMTRRYYHDHIGVNSRLDSIQAAILGVKLKYLDDYGKARQKAAAFYNNAFMNHPNLQTPAEFHKSSHVYHQYTILTKDIDRDELIAKLGEKNVPAMIYYPVPLHLQHAYKDTGCAQGDLPITEMLSERVFSLPMHTELSEEQLEYITKSVLQAIG